MLTATYVTVGNDNIEVELVVTAGVLVAPGILPQLDPNGDKEITQAEGEAYATKAVADVSLTWDGADLPLALGRVEVPTYRVVQAGYGEVRATAMARLPGAARADATHALRLVNTSTSANPRFQTNAFVRKQSVVTLGPQRRTSDQRVLEMDVRLDGTEGAAAPSTAATTSQSGRLGGLLAKLDDPVGGLGALVALLGLSAFLGALHALTPGHGKTLVAAYLVGERGRVRHAVALGAVVTFTHTISVVAIGLVALFASAYAVPGVLAPTLQMVSGLLVVGIGLVLLRRRLRALREGGEHDHSHDHSRDHSHDHSHDHDQHPGHQHAHSPGLTTMTHDHGDGHVHTHTVPDRITPKALFALGASGGIVPCPEALAIMVLAVGLGRVGLGLGLILAFSLGLALVLIGLGVILVRARSLLERVLPSTEGPWARAIPIVSAVVVVVVGAGILLAAVSSLRVSVGA